MNDDQLSISTRIEIDKRASMNDIGSFLESVEKNSIVGVKLDVQSLAKQFKEATNMSMTFNDDGSLKAMTSQIVDENGKILEIKKRVNEANELEVVSTRLVNNEVKKQTELEKVKLKHQQAQRDLVLQISKLMNGKNGQYLTTQDIATIEKAQREFKDLGATSMTELNDGLKDTKLTLREIDNNANNTRLKTTVDHVNSLGQSFKNMGLYITSATIIRELWRALREGTQYIKELDEAFTDVAVSMDITREEFNKWTQDARKIAQANGVLTTSIMDMVKIYATAGEDISKVQDKLAGTAMIQNITQWNADETTSAVNSVINQYKLLEKEINGTTGNVANAIEYMGDALIGISNELTIDNVKGIQEMVSAIDDAGAVVENAGGSMEWYMGITGALSESMNATGSEIGGAMRIITARTLQQKQVLEDMGESTEDFELLTANAEKALNSIGVGIRGQGGELREIEDILDDVGSKWDTLSDSSQQFVAEKLAGNNRRSFFVSMMENYDRVTQLTNAGLEAQGELTKANEVRVQSLAGQINILTDKILAFMDGLQPIIHGSVQLGNAILDIVNKIGSVPVALGLVTSAFVGFTKEGRMVRDGVVDITKNLISMAMRTKLTATETKVATVATKGFKLEIGLLQSAMTFGLSLAIGAVVSGLTYLIDRMKNSSKYAKEMADDVSSALGDINSKIEDTSNADKMIGQYKKLGDEISLISSDTEEYRAKVEELKIIKGQLLDLFPTAIAGYDSEGNAILKDAGSLEKLNAQQREQLEIQQTILKNEAISNLDSVKGDLENEIKLRDEALVKAKMWEDYINNTDLTEKQKPAYNNLMKEANEEAKEHNDIVTSLMATMNSYNNVLGITTDEIDNLSNSTNGANDSLNDLSKSSENLGFDDLIVSDDEIRQASEDFVKLSKNISEAKDLLSDINKNGLNFNNAQQVLDMFEDFKGNINDVSVVQEFLNQKITEMGDLANESYLTMSSSSESFWNSSDANSQEYFSNVIKNTSEWERFTKRVNDNLGSIHAQMVNSMGKNYEKYFKDVTNAYNIDLSNCKTAGEARIKIEAEVAEKIAQMRKAVAEASYNHGTVTMADGTEVNYGEYHETADTQAFNTAISQIQSWKNQAINALGQIGSFQQSTFGGSTPMNGSPSSSSSSKKEIEDLDLKIDRYYDLTDAINDLDKALERNETAQENANPKDRLRLMEEEIALYEKKQKAIQSLINEQENQLGEFKNQISKYGGKFDGNGDIIGRTSLLEKLQKQANSLSGDAKEAKKEEIESLMDIIEAYEKLNNETLPDTRNEYEEMTNTIKKAERENLEFIEDIQEQISESYQKYLNERYSALKKSLEKEKNAYLDTYDEEDFDRDLSDENRKLNEIAQQIAIYSRDTSLAGQQRLEQLKQEYEDQQQAISDLIRDREKDLGSDRFDEEMDKLDEELENLLSAEHIAKVVNKALQSGVIDLGDTMMNLNDFMLQSIKDQEDAYFALGSTIKSELIDNLEIAKGLWGSVGNSSITGRSVDMSNSRSAFSNLSDLTSRINGNEIQNIGTQMLYGTQMQLATDNLRQMISNIDMSKLSSMRGILENNNSPLVSVVVEGNMDNVTQNELLIAMESTVQKTITKISKAIK